MSAMLPSRQNGFGVIAAIFILVMLSGLAAALATVSTAQHLGSALDLQGARAYQAARSGIELGLYQALKTSSCDIGAAIPDIALDTMTVSVSCSVVATGNAAEAGMGTIYSITATACSPAGGACPGTTTSPNYVERRLTAIAEK